jgi:hypothetical protein
MEGVSPSQLFARDIHSAVNPRDEQPWRNTFSWVPPAYWNRPKGRRCTHCGEFLPFSAFRPNLRLSSGWSSWCRACCVERNREWRSDPANRERENAKRRVMEREFTCAGCGELFVARHARLTCDETCRRERHRRFDRVRDHASRKNPRVDAWVSRPENPRRATAPQASPQVVTGLNIRRALL